MSKDGIIHSSEAPKPVGAYPHARRVGNLLFLSGVGARIPGNDAIPDGIEAQTEQVIANVRAVLASCGCGLEDVVDVTAYLVNMDRDFEGYNRVYAKHFEGIQAARTTLAIRALPTPISVEFKIVACLPSSS